MSNLINTLNKFVTISLEDKNYKYLKETRNTKYVVVISNLFKFLNKLLVYYRVLELKGTRIMNYCS